MEQPNILRGRLLTIRDITTRKQIELQLRSANQQLEVHLKEVKELQTKLREESIRDHLTGLFNRRYLHEILASGWSLAKRKNWPISLVMIDIDHFKRVNDKYGHTIGDQVLISLSNLLMGCVRKEDIICRFGGEEFIVVLPGASQIDTFHKVDQWRKTFQTSSVVIGNQAINLTFSAGVASFPDDGPDKDQMILMADRRMYLAKESGRNRVFDKRNDPLKNEED